MHRLPKFLAFILGSIFFIGSPVSQLHASQNVQTPLRVDLELVLAVDISGSIDEEEARLQRKGYIDAFTSPEVLAAIRSGYHKRIAVTYFEWARYDYQIPIIPWTLIHDSESARAFSSSLAASPPGDGPRTSISGAIEYAIPMFSQNAFEGTRHVIDISGDGPNNSGSLVTMARDKGIRAGLTINGLPIINNNPSRWGWPPMPNLDLYYRNCVIGGPRAFIIVAKDFKSFAHAIRKKLVLEIAGITQDRERRESFFLARIRPKSVALDRKSPPCDVGERMRAQRWIDDF
ncbi:DUF1194 domain-containing protein [Nitrospinota bacterium]